MNDVIDWIESTPAIYREVAEAAQEDGLFIQACMEYRREVDACQLGDAISQALADTIKAVAPNYAQDIRYLRFKEQLEYDAHIESQIDAELSAA
jgi:hypothetical protein